MTQVSGHTFPQDACAACPPPSGTGEPLNPCPKCGEHVNAHILTTAPECPHGWEPATGPADLAGIHLDAWTEENTP